MSTFNRFCASARNTAKKITQKAEDLVDSTALAFKKKSLQIRIDEQYEKLGETVYRDLRVEEDLESEKLCIIAKIDALFDELALLEQGNAEADAAAQTEAPAAEQTEEE